MDEKVPVITPQQIVKLIADNNKEEQNAIGGYLSLLEKISTGGITANHQFKEVVSVINEIIADEMNHTQKLNALMVKLSGINPAAK